MLKLVSRLSLNSSNDEFLLCKKGSDERSLQNFGGLEPVAEKTAAALPFRNCAWLGLSIHLPFEGPVFSPKGSCRKRVVVKLRPRTKHAPRRAQNGSRLQDCTPPQLVSSCLETACFSQHDLAQTSLKLQS